MDKRVIELVRVSTEGQAAEDRAGIPAQRAVNRQTAAAYGLKIVKTIEMNDVSGAAILAAPETGELLRLMELPEIHGVVAKEFSRLMRPDNFEDYALLQHFIRTSTLLYLPDGPIDFATKAGRLFGTIRAAFAGWERTEIHARLNDAKEAMRRAGKNPASAICLPFGVGYSRERGWYYTPEAEKVRRAFQMFLSGDTGYTAIANCLNLPRTNVRFILQNPIYTGVRVWDEKRDPSPQAYRPKPDGRQGDRPKIKRTPDEIIRVRVLEPLISDEDFARVQELIEAKRRKHWRARSEAPNRYTYNGHLICADCGCLLYTHSSKHDFYVCKSRNTRERRRRLLKGEYPCTNRHMLRFRLEPQIDSLLVQKLTNRGFVYDHVKRYNERITQQSAILRPTGKVETKLRQLNDKRQRVLDAFFEGIIDREERGNRLSEIDNELQVYTRLLEDRRAPESPQLLDLDSVLATIEPFVEWEFLQREEKRLLLKCVCPEISVYRYNVRGATLCLPTGCNKDSHPKTASSPSPALP